MPSSQISAEELARIRCARCGMRADNGRCLAGCDRWPKPDELQPAGRPARMIQTPHQQGAGDAETEGRPHASGQGSERADARRSPVPDISSRPAARLDHEPRFGPGWVAARIRRGEAVSLEICQRELGARLGELAWDSDWAGLL